LPAIFRFCFIAAPVCAGGLLAAATAIQAQSPTGATSIGFVDADVRLVVESVMGDILRLPFQIDPEVRGTVSFQSAAALPADQLLSALEAVLLPIDIIVVRQDGEYLVLPRNKARALIEPAQNGPTGGPDAPVSGDPGFASDTQTLQYIGVTQMVDLARDLIGSEIVTRNEERANSVRISGTGAERQAARDLIARFDVNNLADMRFAIWKLSDANANAVLDELNTIFAPPNNIFDGRVRLVALPRIGSIMAIAADQNDLDRMEPWVRRIEQGSGGKRNVYSYAIQNGRARDIAQSLQLVLGLESGNGTNQPTSDDDGDGEENKSSPPARNFGAKEGLRVVPNDVSNILLIYANGEEYTMVRRALDALDRAPAQVLIEATLAEVTLTDDLRYGLNFQALGNIGSSNLTVTNSNTNVGTPLSSFPGFSVSAISNTVAGVLNALQSKTNVQVLSAPKLQVLNNRPASLQVGDQVPIVTQQAQSVEGAGAPLVNTVELRDTGVILQVTPRINDNGSILMEISQEVSDVAPTTTSGINSPTIQQRRLTTTVVTQSGQMVVLGGLIRNRLTKEKAGIPGLSQIPVIGGLFGRKVAGGSRTELIILITPSIIRGADDVSNTVNAILDNLDLTRPLVGEADRRAVAPLKR
jgi:general secretion pathway protein D